VDNSGWLDIFVAKRPRLSAGGLHPNAAHFKQPMLLFRNKHDGTFDEVGADVGFADIALQSRRGAAFGDLNNDGCVDIVTLNVGEPPSLLLTTVRTEITVCCLSYWARKQSAGDGCGVTVRTGKSLNSAR